MGMSIRVVIDSGMAIAKYINSLIDLDYKSK